MFAFPSTDSEIPDGFIVVTNLLADLEIPSGFEIVAGGGLDFDLCAALAEPDLLTCEPFGPLWELLEEKWQLHFSGVWECTDFVEGKNAFWDISCVWSVKCGWQSDNSNTQYTQSTDDWTF